MQAKVSDHWKCVDPARCAFITPEIWERWHYLGSSEEQPVLKFPLTKLEVFWTLVMIARQSHLLTLVTDRVGLELALESMTCTGDSMRNLINTGNAALL